MSDRAIDAAESLGDACAERAPREHPPQMYGLSESDRHVYVTVEGWLRRNPGRTVDEACGRLGFRAAAYHAARRKAVASAGEAFRDWDNGRRKR